MYIRGYLALRNLPIALFVLLIALSVATYSQSTHAAGNLVVRETGGAVKIRMHQRWESPTRGMVVSLPAVVSTGSDGSIKLMQDQTTISVAANTAIELLEGPVPGQPLQRVIQSMGSAFYDVAPRGPRKLRVETPYLAAVIKGTQFNVTVAAETSSVALFEGRLQIEASDIGDVVDLFEGQLARRAKGDPKITVVKMEDGEPVARSGGAASKSTESAAGSGEDGNTQGNTGTVGSGDGSGLTGDPQVTAEARVPVGDGVASVGVNVSEPGDAVTVEAGLGEVTVKAGAEEGVGGIQVAVDAGAGVDLGGSGVDVGVDAGVDLGAGDVSLGVDAGVDLGGSAVDVGVDAGVDLGAGDVEIDAGVDLGDSGVDVGVDAGVDLGAGDVEIDAGLDLGDSAVDVGVDAGVDLGTGDVEIDVGIAGVDLGVDIDADGGLGEVLDDGLGDLLGDADADTADDGSDEVVPDLGGLLGL